MSHQLAKFRVLILDNYDSFTYNLYHLIVADLNQNYANCEHEIKVIRNDKITLEEINALTPSHIVISPGPGTPVSKNDFGICDLVLRKISPNIPTLGVCLGHQGIAHVFGAKIIQAPEIVHGKTSLIYHKEKSVFSKLPNPFVATRYHSLVVDATSIPSCLQVIAYSKNNLIMGLKHCQYPIVGVQFHPESIGTSNGQLIIHNFLQISPK